MPAGDSTIIAGAKLEFSSDLVTPAYTVLEGIREFPDFREESEEREVTTVRDKVRQYDEAMDAPSELDLTAFYYKDDADQLSFRTLARNKATVLIRVTYDDEDTLEFTAKLKNYGINGGAAEADKMWTCTVRRTTPITFTEAVTV